MNNLTILRAIKRLKERLLVLINDENSSTESIDEVKKGIIYWSEKLKNN